MTRVTQLLRNAASRQRAIQNEQNRLVDMDWNLSAKTAVDYESYVSYYNDLATKVDPKDALSIQNKLISARKSFIRNEIQRESIGILEGTSTNNTKLNKLVSFYNEAFSNGDYDLAQDLRLQINTLYATVAEEQVNTVNTAMAAAEQNYKDVKAYVDALAKGDAAPVGKAYSLNQMVDFYRNTTPEQFSQFLQDQAQKEGVATPTFEQAILGFAEAAVQAASSQASQYATDTAEYQELSNKVVDLQTKDVFSLPGIDGDFKVSLNDLREAVVAQQTNQTGPFTPAISRDGRTSGFVRNDIGQYELGINPETGEYEMVARYTTNNLSNMLTKANAVPYGRTIETGRSNIEASLGEYSLITADLGKGEGPQTYGVKNGEVFEVSGNRIGKKVSSLDKLNKNYEKALKEYERALAAGEQVGERPQTPFAQQYATPEEALKQKGYEVKNNQILINGTFYPYRVDNMGNIQYTVQRPNEQGKLTAETVTLDLRTNRTSTASEDVAKIAAERQRVQQAARPSGIQGQGGSTAILQGADTSRVLQQAQQVQRTAQVQQTAGVDVLQQPLQQPLKVSALPQQVTPVKVMPTPAAPTLAVAPAPPLPPLSVYQAPLTVTAPLRVTTPQPRPIIATPMTTVQPNLQGNAMTGGKLSLQGGGALQNATIRVQ